MGIHSFDRHPAASGRYRPSSNLGHRLCPRPESPSSILSTLCSYLVYILRPMLVLRILCKYTTIITIDSMHTHGVTCLCMKAAVSVALVWWLCVVSKLPDCQ